MAGIQIDGQGSAQSLNLCSIVKHGVQNGENSHTENALKSMRWAGPL
jgi:hypothetical protein